MQKLCDIGSVRSISLPDDWFESKTRNSDIAITPGWSREFLLSSDRRVNIALACRSVPVDHESAAVFQQLRNLKPGYTGKERLTEKEIVSLQMVMGFKTAGNNQYTTGTLFSASGGPAFSLTEALMRQIASQAVLFVRGHFRSGRHYAGIFYQSDTSPRIIEEVMIHASDRGSLRKHLIKFENAVDSIDWRSAS